MDVIKSMRRIVDHLTHWNCWKFRLL